MKRNRELTDEYVKHQLPGYLRHLADLIEAGIVTAVIGHQTQTREGSDLFYLLRGGNQAAHEVRLSSAIRYSPLPALFELLTPAPWEKKPDERGP